MVVVLNEMQAPPASDMFAVGLREGLIDRGALRHQVGREITLLSVQPNVSMASFARMFTVLREHRIGVPGDVAAAFRSLASLERALRLLDRSAAGLSVTDTGAITALRLKPSANSANAARAAIEQALGQAVYRTVALPDAPVGVGARWVVRQQVSSEILLDRSPSDPGRPPSRPAAQVSRPRGRPPDAG